MNKILAVIPLLLFACTEGPAQVDASLFDAGDLPQKDAGDDTDAADTGVTDTGTTANDAGDGDADLLDGDQADGDLLDGDQPDGDQPDGDLLDGDQPDGDQPDGDLLDGDLPDVDPNDGGVAMEFVEDFTDPADEIFTCSNGIDVLPAERVENGTQCLGIDGSGCPDERGLPGPGSVECADPQHNPFIGTGQCVTDFFSCFDPMGTCTNDGAGTFTWGNGAVQIIQVDAMGRLIQSQFIPSTGGAPCIIGLPDVAGGTRVIYTQQ